MTLVKRLFNSLCQMELCRTDYAKWRFAIWGSPVLCTIVTDGDDIGKLLERFWYFEAYDEETAQKQSPEEACVVHFFETYIPA